MPTKWYLDGWELTVGETRDVESRSGWYYVPEARGEATTVSNRTGVIWNPKRRGAGSFSLEMWFAGVTEAEAIAEYELAVRAASPTHRLVVVRRIMPDGQSRMCSAELVGNMSPVPVGKQGFRASLQFSIPDGTWRTEQHFVFPSGVGATSLTLPALSKSTAAIERLSIDITGPATNPIIRDLTPGGDGDWVKYAGTIPAGGTLHLDSWTWWVGSTGFTVNQAAVIPKGSRFLTLYPIPPAQNASHTLGIEGVGGVVTVTAYPSFH